MTMDIDNIWQYSTIHNSPCKVIEEQNLWGNIVYRFWLPNQDTVVRVPQSALRPLTEEIQKEVEVNRITYVASAAKVAEALLRNTNMFVMAVRAETEEKYYAHHLIYRTAKNVLVRSKSEVIVADTLTRLGISYG